MRLLPAALLLCSCQDAASPEEWVQGKYFDHTSLTAGEIAWLESYGAAIERTFATLRVPRVRIYGYELSTCPAPYCVEEDDGFAVACAPSLGRCIPRLARAIVDANLSMPQVLRDGLVEVLSGGLGHGDYFDVPLDRSLEVDRLFDDRSYLEARQRVSDLEWVLGTSWPAADFVRFVLDESVASDDGLQVLAHATDSIAWDRLGGLGVAMARWRQLPERTGRMFRLPLVECALDRRVSFGHLGVPTYFVSLVYAPDLDIDEWLHRVGVVSFEVAERSNVEVTVTSGVAAPPTLRLELCSGSQDPGRFARLRNEAGQETSYGAGTLDPGVYFLLVGSDFGPNADVPELVSLKATPLP